MEIEYFSLNWWAVDFRRKEKLKREDANSTY